MEPCPNHGVLVERIDRTDKRLEGHDEMFEKVTDGLRDMAVSMERTSTLQQTMADALSELKKHDEKQDERVTAIEMQPASTFKEIRGYLLAATVGAAFTYLPQIMSIIR